MILARNKANNYHSVNKPRIRKLSHDGLCTFEAMCAVMDEEKKPEQDHVTIKNDVLRKYFPKDATPRQMENQIIKLLDQWQKKDKEWNAYRNLLKTAGSFLIGGEINWILE